MSGLSSGREHMVINKNKNKVIYFWFLANLVQNFDEKGVIGVLRYKASQ